jgi:hypothetical protein
MIVGRCAFTWSQRPAPTTAAPPRDIQQSWSPADWAPTTNSRIGGFRRTPQDYTPEGVPRQIAVSREAESLGEPWDNITVANAHRLLGTTTTCTREQIRSAYLPKVSEWHPDRLLHTSEAVRECATQQMAVINEAYRLLRTALLKDAD